VVITAPAATGEVTVAGTPARPWRDVVERASPGVVMLAIVGLLYRPGWGSMARTLPLNLGDPALNTWILAWQTHAVTDPSSWFDGNIFATHGSALGYSEVMLPLVPVFAIVYRLSDNPVLAHNVVLLVLLCLSMGCTYLLARHLGVRRALAVAAATGFTFSSYTFVHLAHLQLMTLGLFPLCLLLWFRLLDRPQASRGLWFGVASAALVTGCLYYATIWVLSLLVLVGAHLVRSKGRPGARWWRCVGLAGAVTTVLVLPVAIAYLRFQSEVDFQRPLVPEYGADASDVLAPSPGSYLYRTLADAAGARPAAYEHAFFPGLLLLAGAVLAAVLLVATLGRRGGAGGARAAVDARWWDLLALGLVAVVVAVGPDVAGLPAPFRLLYHHVPGFDSIRVPGRLIIPALLVVVLAAARALQWLFGAVGAGRAARLAVVAVVVLELAAPLQRASAVPTPVERDLYAFIDDLPDAPILHLPAASDAMGSVGVYGEDRRMLFSIGDWRLRFNGTSGGNPPGFAAEVDLVNRFPDPEALEFVRRHGLRFVVLHWSADGSGLTMPTPQAEAILAAMAASVVHRDAGVAVLDLGAGSRG